MGILSFVGIGGRISFGLRSQILSLGVSGVAMIGAIYLVSLQVEARSRRSTDEFATWLC